MDRICAVEVKVRARLALLLALSCLLCGCALDVPQAEQRKVSGVADGLWGTHALGQTFHALHNGLYRVDVYLEDASAPLFAPIEFYLKASADSPEALATARVEPGQIREGVASFVFAPLADSAGREYYFVVAAPAASAAYAPRFLLHASDRYTGGTLVVDGAPVPGDLVFVAYARREFTAGGVLGEFAGRMGADAGFFAPYGLLMLAVAALWVLSLRAGKRIKGGDKP